MKLLVPRLPLPRFYPILDAGLLLQTGRTIAGFAGELRDAGVRFLQYRDKDASDSELLGRASILRQIFPARDSCLILNDRALLVSRARYQGVHVGQEDLSPVEARALLGPDALIGVSTHDQAQLLAAAEGPADYLAIGPVFATQSKLNPDPVVGLEGVRLARALTAKPIVAIGGIDRSNCLSVLKSGADSVAVISDLIPRRGQPTGQIIADFLALTGAA